MRLFRVVFLVACGFGQAWCVEIRALGGTEVLLGDSPKLVVSGLKPGEAVTLHAYRPSRYFTSKDYEGTRVLAHAYAEFRADSSGVIDVDRAAPVRGTYAGLDPLGLLWSGERMEWAEMGLKSTRSVLIRLDRGSGKGGELMLQLTDGADRVEIQVVSEKNLNGVFARPKSGAERLRSIILLHGSNGGTVEDARAEAIRFAQLGYAAFALNYFSWAGLGSLPRGLVNIPVENLAAAREWLSRQPKVETGHVAVWGVSKGAEYALVAAANLKWIDRVVACVPSSVVWSGFGREPLPGEIYSSWSVAGRSLPFVPYDNYEDVLQGRLSAGAVHRRSLEKASATDREAARIPIENSDARILLIGATRDHVWPSAEMVREMEGSLGKAIKSDRVRALVFEGASHFICGTGEETQRITPVVNPEGNSPSPEDTARAAGQAWAETKRFLGR